MSSPVKSLSPSLNSIQFAIKLYPKSLLTAFVLSIIAAGGVAYGAYYLTDSLIYSIPSGAAGGVALFALGNCLIIYRSVSYVEDLKEAVNSARRSSKHHNVNPPSLFDYEVAKEYIISALEDKSGNIEDIFVKTPWIENDEVIPLLRIYEKFLNDAELKDSYPHFYETMASLMLQEMERQHALKNRGEVNFKLETEDENLFGAIFQNEEHPRILEIFYFQNEETILGKKITLPDTFNFSNDKERQDRKENADDAAKAISTPISNSADVSNLLNLEKLVRQISVKTFMKHCSSTQFSLSPLIHTLIQIDKCNDPIARHRLTRFFTEVTLQKMEILLKEKKIEIEDLFAECFEIQAGQTSLTSEQGVQGRILLTYIANKLVDSPSEAILFQKALNATPDEQIEQAKKLARVLVIENNKKIALSNFLKKCISDDKLLDQLEKFISSFDDVSDEEVDDEGTSSGQKTLNEEQAEKFVSLAFLCYERDLNPHLTINLRSEALELFVQTVIQNMRDCEKIEDQKIYTKIIIQFYKDNPKCSRAIFEDQITLDPLDDPIIMNCCSQPLNRGTFISLNQETKKSELTPPNNCPCCRTTNPGFKTNENGSLIKDTVIKMIVDTFKEEAPEFLSVSNED